MVLLYILLCLEVVCIGKVHTACNIDKDPCKRGNAQEIPYLYSRHPSVPISAATGDDIKYCDLYALMDGRWYISDYQMTSRQVGPSVCGTKYPIWMNDTHPDVADGVVNRTACLATFTDGCARTYTVLTKNCLYYNVYCFWDLPEGCPQRYCFDVDQAMTTTLTTPKIQTEPTDPVATTESYYTPPGGNDCKWKHASFIIFAVLLVASVSANVILAVVVKKMRGRETVFVDPSLTQATVTIEDPPMYKEKITY